MVSKDSSSSLPLSALWAAGHRHRGAAERRQGGFCNSVGRRAASERVAARCGRELGGWLTEVMHTAAGGVAAMDHHLLFEVLFLVSLPIRIILQGVKELEASL